MKLAKEQIYRFPMPVLDESMYILVEKDEALVVDPNKNEEARAFLKEKQVKKLLILLTHEHFDHISGVNILRENFDCKVICNEAAADAIGDPHKNLAKYWEVLIMDKSLENQKEALKLKDEEYSCQADDTFSTATEWQWQGYTIKAVPTPGHSKGSAVYFIDDVVFSGDSLVNGHGVITRLPGGKWKIYSEQTLPLIQDLSDDMLVFPGHGNPDRLCNLRQYLTKA